MLHNSSDEMDTDTHAYMVVCLFQVSFLSVFNINFYWHNLLMHVVIMITVSPPSHICEETLNKRKEEEESCHEL